MEKEKNTDSLYHLGKLAGFVGNNPASIHEMVSLFLETIPPELQLLKNSSAAKDFNEVAVVAHRIKPSIDVFGMHAALSMIRLLEVESRDTTLHSHVDEIVNKFCMHMESVLTALRKEL